jgi:hypothetical protein
MLVIIYNFFILFLHFSTTINIKIFSFFFYFLYHINNFFITIQIKKLTTIQNLFTFLYKFFLLYITSSLFTNFKINNPLLCSVHVFAKQALYFFHVTKKKKKTPPLFLNLLQFYGDILKLSKAKAKEVLAHSQEAYDPTVLLVYPAFPTGIPMPFFSARDRSVFSFYFIFSLC